MPMRRARLAPLLLAALALAGDRLVMRVGRGEPATDFAMPGGTPQAGTLHLRTVFEEAEARRADAPAGRN